MKLIPVPRELLHAWGWSCSASPSALIPGKGCPATPRTQGATSPYGSLTHVLCEAAQQSSSFPSPPQIYVMNPQRNLLRVTPLGPHQLAAPSALTAALGGAFPVAALPSRASPLRISGLQGPSPTDLPAASSPNNSVPSQLMKWPLGDECSDRDPMATWRPPATLRRGSLKFPPKNPGNPFIGSLNQL